MKTYTKSIKGFNFMSRVTIKDVAKQAGVSKSMVSHVINNTRHVEEDTKRRVLEAIDALDYHPSSVALSLISKRTKTAGLLISDKRNNGGVTSGSGGVCADRHLHVCLPKRADRCSHD